MRHNGNTAQIERKREKIPTSFPTPCSVRSALKRTTIKLYENGDSSSVVCICSQSCSKSVLRQEPRVSDSTNILFIKSEKSSKMSEKNKVISGKNQNLKLADAGPQDDVDQQNGARATTLPDHDPKLSESDVPPKKRKTRRGKSKRKAPYQKYGRVGRKNGKVVKPHIIKPEAPHNDNQFLLEDHGGFEELDQRLKNIDQASTSTITRTRDSSFSVDSDGDFYSSPDDEDDFLMQDFNDQYQSIQTEQLQTMSKQELIDEYLSLDNRSTQKYHDLEDKIKRLEKDLEKHKSEKEILQRENELLKSKLEETQNRNSDSEDSETDSSDSCSSSSSSSSDSGSSRSVSPVLEGGVDFTKTNGHNSPPTSVDPV